jgi:hypothetical protein
VDKIQIYITKEELEIIIDILGGVDKEYGLEIGEQKLYDKLDKLNDNWKDELEKQEIFARYDKDD